MNGDKCTLSTGKQVAVNKWDKTKQQVKGKDEEAQSLNNCLKSIKAKLYQKEAELLDNFLLNFILTVYIEWQDNDVLPKNSMQNSEGIDIRTLSKTQFKTLY